MPEYINIFNHLFINELCIRTIFNTIQQEINWHIFMPYLLADLTINPNMTDYYEDWAGR